MRGTRSSKSHAESGRRTLTHARLPLIVNLFLIALIFTAVVSSQELTRRKAAARGPSSDKTSEVTKTPEKGKVTTSDKPANKARKSPGRVNPRQGEKEDTLILPMEFFGESQSLNDIARQSKQAEGDENNGMLQEDQMEPLHEDPDGKAAAKETELLVGMNAVQSIATTPLAAAAGTTFEGPGLGMPGFVIAGAPPDTTLAVGPNHVVAWVNTQLAIFDKSGTPLLPAPGFVNGNSLFAGMGNLCETTNRGDPILQYDRMADRWIFSQFAFGVNASGNPIAPYLQCFAISTNPNPAGPYFRYSVTFSPVSPSGFNDYGKLGIWPDAYYTSYNMFGGSPAGANTGAALCASDRTKMLLGDPTATTLCAPIAFYAGGAAFLPADLDGPTPPTDVSQGGIFARYSFGGISLRLMKLKPNFAASTVTLTNGVGGASGTFIDIPVGPTTVACNGAAGACVRQPATTTLLDTLADRLMYRLVYRNRAGIDSLIVTQSVDPDGAGARGAAERWYEIRNPLTAAPTLLQNSTYDPGSAGDRWMGSMAMDKYGNMLMGYSIANVVSGLKPSIAVAGRVLADPASILSAENIFLTGTGSQTVRSNGTALTRWGDYTTMQVDPADDATFWFIGQYLAADGVFNWRTRVGSFKFIPVLAPTGSTLVNESCPPSNGAIDPGESVTVNLQVTNNGGAPTTNLVGTLQASGNVLAPSGPQSYGVVPQGGSTGRSFTFTAQGSCGQTITLALQLQDGATNLGTVNYTFVLGCNTACAGAPRISTSATLSCNSGNTVANVTVTNSGTATANNVQLTVAKLGGVSGTPLAQSLGNIAAGASVNTTVTFSGAPSGVTTLQLGGTYTGGSYNSSRKVVAPSCAAAAPIKGGKTAAK